MGMTQKWINKLYDDFDAFGQIEYNKTMNQNILNRFIQILNELEIKYTITEFCNCIIVAKKN